MSRQRVSSEMSGARQAVMRIYEAINRRDFAAGFALVDLNFEWQVPERALWAGTHRGEEEIRPLLESQLEVFEDFAITPEEVFEGGDQVVVFVSQRGRGGASGVEVEIRLGHLWTLRGGRPVRLEVFPEREKALEAAGLPRSQA